MSDIPSRLEYLRQQIRAECISYGEIAELQDLAEHIEPGDTELLEWAGVPEHPEDTDKKALVVLVIDHDTFSAESAPPPGSPLDDEVLISFGREANSMAAHWLGYEAWMVVADVPEPLLEELGKLNLPLKGE